MTIRAGKKDWPDEKDKMDFHPLKYGDQQRPSWNIVLAFLKLKRNIDLMRYYRSGGPKDVVARKSISKYEFL